MAGYIDGDIDGSEARNFYPFIFSCSRKLSIYLLCSFSHLL